MNHISKNPLSALGYDFISKEYIPKGKDEYHLRNIQHRSPTRYRKLKKQEIRELEQLFNSSDNWNQVWVADPFYPQLIRNCNFHGWVRIGHLEPCFREFNNLRMPVGLYNSTIISSDIGNNVVIDNVNYISHYIVGNDVMLVNIHEIATTDHSKFGNGVLKQGEKESVRIWMEICNENAGRSVLPFNGMKAGDAWLWSRYRDDENLLLQLKNFTDKKFDTRRGYYGKIGDRTVIKNCSIIKDVWVGTDAYIKGANKLKNLTINSSPEAKSQIGEGCELVNGIIGFGSRIFYGVKAVRFMLGSNSQLKYGARLINSYLGDNSTISCCEVLNSLIFPAHEQHHNNSFLCAATVLGQSNMAAGATIGSNHNSRGADGEIIAGRGFWPALCVSLKHNSKFASYTLISKGDFPNELDIPFPFSLVSNDTSQDRLLIRPGYWFQYNMYALARNAGKYTSRDKRIDKTQHIEYDFLAPDTVNEILDTIPLLEQLTAQAFIKKNNKKETEKNLRRIGRELLEKKPASINYIEVGTRQMENSDRPVILIKVAESYSLFRKIVGFYGMTQLLRFISDKKIKNWQKLQSLLPATPVRNEWKNIGGQLIPTLDVQRLVRSIRQEKITSWDEVHDFYARKSQQYALDKFRHAYASLLEVLGLKPRQFTKKIFLEELRKALAVKEWMVSSIHDSRAKDYQNKFRKMVYETDEEMNNVIGRLEDNSFIRQQQEELAAFRESIQTILNNF